MKKQLPKHYKGSFFFMLAVLAVLSVVFFVIARFEINQHETTSAPGQVSGDVNGDGIVDKLDIKLFIQAFGQTSSTIGYNPNADFNGDNKVNILDLQILGSNFGKSEVRYTETPELISSPSSTHVPTATPSPSSPTQDGMWVSKTELQNLPTSGNAWEKMKETAYEEWGTADLTNQDNKHAINTLAGALVYARIDDVSLRTKVKDAIIEAKQSLDESSEWKTRNGVLAAGRQIGAYVIAADLITLEEYDAAANNEFRNWLQTIRTTNIGTHGRWKSLTYTCENAAANWNTFACASRIAASIYLGDTADIERSSMIIRAFFGERSEYPQDAPGKDDYFQHTAAYESSWSCNDAAWTAINPPCVIEGVNVDGTLVEDASRGGGCCALQDSGISYSWEALQGLIVSTELLYRTGNYGDPYEWSEQALKRAIDNMERSGWEITKPATYVPWLANARYGTSYPTPPNNGGRIMSWGDWLYQ